MTTSSNEQGEPHVGNNEPPTEPQTPAVESTTASSPFFPMFKYVV